MAPTKKKLSREELLQKKREAERLRYQRRKNDPLKRQEMREKEKLKYQKKKDKGLRKLVKDMTPREHRAALKKWKEHCTVYRAKRLRLKSITNTFVRENTPLSDPEETTPPSRPATPVPVQIHPVPSPAILSASLEQRKREGSKKRKEEKKKKKKKEKDQKGFKGTLKVHQVAGVYSFILGLPKKCKTITMKSLSCFCNISCEHNKIGNINYTEKRKWTVEEVFTESEPEDLESVKPELKLTPNKYPQRSDNDEAETSGIRHSSYNTGDYVLVKFPTKNVEYRYAAVINDIDEDENELRVTFLKICNQEVQTFRIDEQDISDVSFDQSAML